MLTCIFRDFFSEDFFEVAIVIGACFLVNSVTDDAKTNWAEGLVLLSFYFMIVSTTWPFFFLAQKCLMD